MSEAVQLTREAAGLDDDAATLQVVTFMLGGEEYGFHIGDVQEIIRMRNVRITAIPNTAAFVEGVVNLRGRMIPVVDLRARFGMESVERGRSHRIVFLVVDGRSVGVVVDEVVEVVRVRASEIEKLPEIAAGVSSEFIEGVCRVGDRMVIVLDTTHLFSSAEEAALADAASE